MPETTKKILEWYSKATKVEIIKTTITTIARTVIDPSPLDRATIGIGQSLHTKNKETAIVKITARKNPKTKNEANRRVQTRPTITTKNGVEETIHHFFVACIGYFLQIVYSEEKLQIVCNFRNDLR